MYFQRFALFILMVYVCFRIWLQVARLVRYLLRQDSNNFLHINIRFQINLPFPIHPTFFQHSVLFQNVKNRLVGKEDLKIELEYLNKETDIFGTIGFVLY
jgi:hypothetical protein